MATPDHAIVVNNYAEFRDDITAFADGKINFLLVIGRTGVGKTETVQEIVGLYIVFDGRPSAWGLYRGLYECRHATVLLDDVSPPFYSDPTCQSHLKLPHRDTTEENAQLAHSSGGPGQGCSEIVRDRKPRHCADKPVGVDQRAYSCDREPSLRHDFRSDAGGIASREAARLVPRSGDSTDFIWAYRRFITRPDMRVYRRIAEQKRAGRPWRKRDPRNADRRHSDARNRKAAGRSSV